MSVQLHIGKKLKELRKQTGLSQESVAEYLGIGRTTLCNIECGKQGVLNEYLWKLCGLYKCEIGCLFPPLEPVEIKEERKEVVVTKTRIKITKLINP